VLEGHALATLASIHRAAGRHTQAADHARQSLVVHQETGHRLGQARALVLLGHAHDLAGDADAAATCWQDAADIYTECGAGDAATVRPLLAPATGRHADAPTGA
jgi:Tetratricopeptide repeat